MPLAISGPVQNSRDRPTRDHTVNMQSAQDIPIVTPVPLPYTARSVAVLRSMVSFGPIQGLSGSLEERLLQSEALSGCDSDDPTLQEDRMTQHGIPPFPPFKPVVQTFRPIRPVSPSTLMALTEPCLMEWCTEASRPTSILPPTIYHSYPTSVQMMNPQIQKNSGQWSRNLWGY